MNHILMLLACCLAVVSSEAQSLDNQLLLPPVSNLDHAELVDETEEAVLAPTNIQKDTSNTSKISLDDVVIYGKSTFKTTPGSKIDAPFMGMLIQRDAPHSTQRDNLYRYLPHVDNKFLLSRDWALRDKFLSKLSVNYGAWNTLNGNLIIGRQNFLLRTDQLVDLFINVLFQQGPDHTKNSDYYNRATGFKGTCLYEIERNVETKTYIDYYSGLYHQPHQSNNRTINRTEIGLLLNAYKGDYAATNVHLAFTAGKLSDTTKTTDRSSLILYKGSLKRYGLLMHGEGSYYGYSLIPPGTISQADTTQDIPKQKTDLFKLALHEDGWRLPLATYDIILDGGLTLWGFTNYLYGKRVRTIVHPSFNLHYAAHQDLDIHLRFSPEMTFTPLASLVAQNRFIKKDVELVPQDQYINIVAGGEYRYPGGITLSTTFGYDRTRRSLRLQFNPIDSLYEVRTKPDSLYTTGGVQTGKFSFTLKTKEWHHTLVEAFYNFHATSFINDTTPVPYAPRSKTGITVAGTWFYNIEQRWHVYHVARRYWGTQAHETLPAYTMLNIALTKNVNEEFKIYVTSSLSLDGKYRQWHGYTTPQMDLATGIRLRW